MHVPQFDTRKGRHLGEWGFGFMHFCRIGIRSVGSGMMSSQLMTCRDRKRTQTHMGDLDKKMEEKKERIISLQQQAQQAQQGKGQPKGVTA